MNIWRTQLSNASDRNSLTETKREKRQQKTWRGGKEILQFIKVWSIINISDSSCVWEPLKQKNGVFDGWVVSQHVTQRHHVIFAVLNKKILLIRWHKCFKIKKTSVRFEHSTYWSSVRHHNHYTKEPTVSGRHRKAFSNLQWPILVEFR